MMKVKSKHRLKILLGIAALLVLLLAGAWAARKYQIRKTYARYRAEGMAAQAAGHNQEAIQFLEKYVGRNPADVDALIAYAHARQSIPLPGGAHLSQAAQILRSAIRLDPTRTVQQHELLGLYGRIGAGVESIALAEDILKADPRDVEALKTRAIALAAMKKVDDGLAAAQKWAEVDKTNPEAHLLVISFLWASKGATVAMEHANALSAADVGQQTKQLVQARTLIQVGRPDDAKPLLLQLAAAVPKDKTAALMVSDGLERLGLVKESMALLREAAASGDPEIRQRLLRRVWQSGDVSGYIELVGTPDSMPEAQWAEQSALKMISLRRLKRQPEADALETALKARPGELESAWLAAEAELNGVALDQKTAVQLRDQCRAGLRLDLANPFLTECLADSMRVLGDQDTALQLFEDLSARNPSWLVPILRVVELQMALGHVEQALDAANLGLARAPQNVHMAAVLANVWDAAIDQKKRTDEAELLGFVQRIQQAVPGEELSLNVYIRRLASAGRTEEAKTALATALAKETAPTDQTSLFTWAQTSLQFNLGLEQQCMDRSEHAFGVTPQSALFRAYLLLNAGHPDDGLKWLKSNTPPADSARANLPAWQLVQARYLDLIQSPDAPGFWAKICDDYPQDLDIQQSALSSPSIRTDHQLQQRVIDHVGLISGKDSQLWKLSQSRWLVSGAFSEQDAQLASGYLGEIIKSAPSLVEPRFLLARCFEKLNNLPQAIEQLSSALQTAPDNSQTPTLELYLAELLQRSGDFAGAQQHLAHLAASAPQNPQQRQSEAMLLSKQGDAAQAAELLRPLQGQSRDADMLLADLYFRSHQPDRAAAITEKLMQSPDLAAARMAVDLYADMGREAEAEKILDQIDNMNVDPDEKLVIRANFQTKFGSGAAAIEILRKAVAQYPTKPLAWRALASTLLLESKTTDAFAAAADGIKQVPGDPVLAGILKREALIQAAADHGLLPLSIGLVQSPDDPALVDAATLLTAPDANSPSQARVYCSQLQDRYPHSLPVQLVVIDRYLLFRHPQEAAALAARATQAFPFSPEPPKIAVQCFAQILDWTQALAMAKIWRQRDAAHQMSADLAIADILCQNSQYADAAAALEPYLATAAKMPENSAVAVTQYALALCRAGQSDKAQASLQPLLGGGGPIYETWLRTAVAALPREQAEAWMQRMTQSSDNSLATTTALARAHGLLSKRFNDDQHKSKAIALLHDLSGRPDLPAPQLLAIGLDLETLGDIQAAEQIYRKINPADDSAGIARNNLAMILARRGDSAAAVQMAQSAVQSAPGRTYALDTLAFAQRKSNNLTAAVATLRQAIQIEPWSTDLRMTLTEVLIEAVKPQEAKKELTTIEDMLSTGGQVPESVKQRLTTLQKSLDVKASAQAPQTNSSDGAQSAASRADLGVAVGS